MHQRKPLMADLSDAFVALPAGFGTLKRVCEVVTWTQLGLHAKPCGVLNVLGVKFQIAPGAGRSDQGRCRDQTWSQFWSQNGMVAGVSVLPNVVGKIQWS